jgi:hypothetical protein
MAFAQIGDGVAGDDADVRAAFRVGERYAAAGV